MTTTSTIYVVQATVTYEGSDPVCAFTTETAANDFVKRCNDHEAKYRNCPELNAPEEEWQEWQAHTDRWEKRHPAKPYFKRDYSVTKLKLKGA
jgi:hypothetical protein